MNSGQESVAVSEVPRDLWLQVGSEVSLAKMNRSFPGELKGHSKPRAGICICVLCLSLSRRDKCQLCFTNSTASPTAPAGVGNYEQGIIYILCS